MNEASDKLIIGQITTHYNLSVNYCFSNISFESNILDFYKWEKYDKTFTLFIENTRFKFNFLKTLTLF